MSEISVIIPTRNRAPFLGACITSLCNQTFDPAHYEICVVNNGSTDNTPDIVASSAKQFPRHKIFLVDEPQAGLSRARNCGINATTAPLIANIDDDATAAPNWLERYAARYREFGNDVAKVGGEVVPVWPPSGPPSWMTHWLNVAISASTGLGQPARFLKPGEYMFEGNSCYRRTALVQAGLFPVELGRSGTNLLSGDGLVDDVMRNKFNAKLFFDPDITIHHTIHADRLTPLWFRHRFFWGGVTRFAQYKYFQRMGMPVPAEQQFFLPSTSADWAFLFKDNADDIENNARKFEALGFVLAMSGFLKLEVNN